MANHSQSLPLFEKSCNDVLSRLSGDESDEAVTYAAEARRLLAMLGKWKQEAPAHADRAAVISRVLDLHRAVMEYTTATGAHSPSTQST